MRWQAVIVLAVVGIVLVSASAASAHAALVRSMPSANAALPKTPEDLRLWFSEALEPRYSHFTLRDSNGQIVQTPPSQIDPADKQQMFMQPRRLPDGLYNVAWHSVSAADGHSDDGSFAFTIGAASGVASSTTSTDPIRWNAALVRWLNLLGLSLVVGSIAFVLFVWVPTIPDGNQIIERRLTRLIWIGWGVAGVGGVLMLLLQASLALDVPLLGAFGNPALGQFMTGTRYGTLWFMRMLIWLTMGGALLLAVSRPRMRWVALGLGIAMLLTHSLFTHASAVQDSLAAVSADWLHLTFTALWVGGLAQFIAIIRPVRRTIDRSTQVLARMVAYFSNYARICVIGLVTSGVYAAWLQVGTLEGLLSTSYGLALVAKLVLFLPLVAIAGINLVWTQRRLASGQVIWVERLRGLVAVEIVLIMGMLFAVGIMTSLNIPRAVLAERSALLLPLPNPVTTVHMKDDLHAQLTISSASVGDNMFTMNLSTMEGALVNDVSLIRLRFDNQDIDLGQSELRITQGTEGVYTVRGANLSAPGQWRIRAMIQRPDQFDTIVDFFADIKPAPAARTIDAAPPVPQRLVTLVVAGIAALIVGFLFALPNRKQLSSSSTLMGIALIGIGAVFLVSAGLLTH